MALVNPTEVSQPTIKQSVSPVTKCWRLIYDSTKLQVISLFEAAGEQKTNYALFVSDKDGLDGLKECLEYVIENKLMLNLLPANVRFMPQSAPHSSVTHPTLGIPTQVPIKK